MSSIIETRSRDITTSYFGMFPAASGRECDVTCFEELSCLILRVRDKRAADWSVVFTYLEHAHDQSIIICSLWET